MDIKTLHGHIFTCSRCHKIHFEFNQLSIDFANLYLLNGFKSYLDQIDQNNKYSNETQQYIRKIHIPFPRTNLKMVLTQNELKELIILIQTFVRRYRSELEKKDILKKLSAFTKIDLN